MSQTVKKYRSLVIRSFDVYRHFVGTTGLPKLCFTSHRDQNKTIGQNIRLMLNARDLKLKTIHGPHWEGKCLHGPHIEVIRFCGPHWGDQNQEMQHNMLNLNNNWHWDGEKQPENIQKNYHQTALFQFTANFFTT